MGRCPNCGIETSADHTFCLECGAELPQSGGQEASAAAPPATRAPAPSERPGQAPGSVRGLRDLPRAPSGSSAMAFVPPLAALVLGVALQLAADSVIPSGSYVHRLFRPSGGWLMSVVPGLIAFVFIWTLADLLVKLRVAVANEKDLLRPELAKLPALVQQEGIAGAANRILGRDASLLTRPVGRRMYTLLQHIEATDAQRAHELTRHQSDLESDTAASGYRTPKLFIWAMPILGFIGTVLGISLAVGGFSDFLTTNVSIDEIDAVTAELGNVASGLSFAFDTTLLGLLGGLVSSVVSSGVQAREERLLTGIEELGLRVMESAGSEEGAYARSSRAVATADPGAEFDGMMRERLADLSRQMESFTIAVEEGLHGFLGEWSKLPPEVERVARDLQGLREHLGSAARSTDQLLLETRVLLEGLNETSTQMGNRLNSSIGSITETVEGLGGNLEGVSGKVAQGLAGLGERVMASEAQLRSGLEHLEATIASSQRDEGAMAQALTGLSATLGELGRQVSELRAAQAKLEPVLSQLSGPLELRLMPQLGATTRTEGDR